MSKNGLFCDWSDEEKELFFSDEIDGMSFNQLSQWIRIKEKPDNFDTWYSIIKCYTGVASMQVLDVLYDRATLISDFEKLMDILPEDDLLYQLCSKSIDLIKRGEGKVVRRERLMAKHGKEILNTGEVQAIEYIKNLKEYAIDRFQSHIDKNSVQEILDEFHSFWLGGGYHFIMALFGKILSDSKIKITFQDRINDFFSILGVRIDEMSIQDLVHLETNMCVDFYNELSKKGISGLDRSRQAVMFAELYLVFLIEFHSKLNGLLRGGAEYVLVKEKHLKRKEKAKIEKSRLGVLDINIRSTTKKINQEKGRNPFLFKLRDIEERKTRLNYKINKRKKFLNYENKKPGIDVSNDPQIKKYQEAMEAINLKYSEATLQLQAWLATNEKIKELEADLEAFKEERKMLIHDPGIF